MYLIWTLNLFTEAGQWLRGSSAMGGTEKKVGFAATAEEAVDHAVRSGDHLRKLAAVTLD